MPDDGRNLPAVQPLRQALDKMAPEFAMALPSHIPVERFKRVALTAINQNEDLLRADRRSVMAACMRAAQDGLLPDGREGAIIVFGGKAQWMPMVYGVLKKARNSGDIASITARCVYERDTFHYVMGDEEKLSHVPMLDGEPGTMRLVYAIAKLKDGEVVREVMTRNQVERARAVSRSKNGPAWTQWYDEMARKTAIKRLAKYLPQSSELDAVMRRDESMAIEGEAVPVQQQATALDPPDAFETASAGVQQHDPATGEVTEAADLPVRGTTPVEPEPEPRDPFFAGDSYEIPVPNKRGGGLDWLNWNHRVRERVAQAQEPGEIARLQEDNAGALKEYAAFNEGGGQKLVETMAARAMALAGAE